MKGFASHYHIESGDDDLFVNEAATKRNCQVEVSIDSHTVSRVKKSFRDWFRQKRRHVTTYKHYNAASKFRLAMLSMSLYFFYGTFAAVLILQFQPIIVLSLFGLRLLIQMLIFNKSMKLLAEKDLLLFSPLIELILLTLYPFVTFANMFVRKNKWK
jgi:hypothetical protein